MREALIVDSISYTKMELLTSNEITLMKNKVIRQLKIYVPGCLLLTVAGLWICLLSALATTIASQAVYQTP